MSGGRSRNPSTARIKRSWPFGIYAGRRSLTRATNGRPYGIAGSPAMSRRAHASPFGRGGAEGDGEGYCAIGAHHLPPKAATSWRSHIIAPWAHIIVKGNVITPACHPERRPPEIPTREACRRSAVRLRCATLRMTPKGVGRTQSKSERSEDQTPRSSVWDLGRDRIRRSPPRRGYRPRRPYAFCGGG